MNKDNKTLSYVFCGSSSWSATILKSLIDQNIKPLAVITKVDKPAGRDKKISFGPLTVFANEYNLKTQQVKNKLEFLEIINQLQPDLVVVVDFGIIITQAALDIPKLGTINVHPSLLPKYRGTSPIQSAIINGDKQTGVSIMKLDADIDHGPIYTQKTIEIEDTDTYGSLLDKIAPIASQELINVINKLDLLKPIEQNHALAIYTKKILTSDCELNLQDNAEKLVRIIKASQPKPCAWLNYNGKRLKIISAHVVAVKESKQFFLECGDGKFLVIEKLQPEGKKVMTGKDFLNGLK